MLSQPRRSSVLAEVMAKAMSQVVDPFLGDDGVDRTLIENNPELQQLELEKCRKDFLYWCGRYFHTFDPRIKDESKRSTLFIPWPRQVDLYNWAIERQIKNQVGLVEKSRDSGVSVFFGAWGLHDWIFQYGFTLGLCSYVEEKVDKLGDMSSLMEKIRYAIRRLPPWMLPKGLNFDKHLMHRRIINPANENIMVGEIGDQIGRGARTTRSVVDEAAYLEHPDAVEASLAATCDNKFFISTPRGIGNWFHRKRMSLPSEQVFTFRYDSDPRKDAAWKEKVLRDDGILIFEREYNLNYAASIEGVCIPADWVMAAVDLPLVAEGDVICGFDVAAEGDNLNSLAPLQGSVLHPLKTWQGLNATQSAHTAARHCEELKATQCVYDCIGLGEAVKGAWDTAALEGEGVVLPFTPVPFLGGEAPSDKVWADGKTSKQKFVNARAEIWWEMRERCRKTWEHRQWMTDPSKGEMFHEVDDMISMPNDPKLIAELSTPLIVYGRGGKIQIESKQQMKKRGVKSPDLADSACYALYRGQVKRDFWFR